MYLYCMHLNARCFCQRFRLWRGRKTNKKNRRGGYEYICIVYISMQVRCICPHFRLWRGKRQTNKGSVCCQFFLKMYFHPLRLRRGRKTNKQTGGQYAHCNQAYHLDDGSLGQDSLVTRIARIIYEREYIPSENDIHCHAIGLITVEDGRHSNFFVILLNQTGIRLYSPFSD